MTTNQKEAERLTRKCVEHYYGGTGVIGLKITTLEKCILEQIPIIQLIAVARAANKAWNGSCCNDELCHSPSCDLARKIEKLKQSGLNLE